MLKRLVTICNFAYILQKRNGFWPVRESAKLVLQLLKTHRYFDVEVAQLNRCAQ